MRITANTGAFHAEDTHPFPVFLNGCKIKRNRFGRTQQPDRYRGPAVDGIILIIQPDLKPVVQHISG